MSVIKFELDTSTDSERVLTILANALLEIAGAPRITDLSALPPSLKEQNPIETDIDKSVTESRFVNQDILLDTDKYPWDERIHSGKHTKNDDGTWKLLRIPKSYKKDEVKWQAFIESVRTELRGETSEESTTQALDNPTDVFGNDENPAVGMEGEQTTTTTTTTTAKTTTTDTSDNTPPADFPAFMKFITSNKDKVNIANVNNICVNFGLSEVSDLMKPDNADMIPMIYNSVLEIIANGASDET
jgi:hypothetical protein